MRTSLLKFTTILSLVVGVGLVAAPAGAASATRVADSGFWWQGNTGVGVQSAPPDVQRGQLLLEAAPTGATSIAAVRAELEDGRGNPTLTLRVASEQGAATATILACQAGSGWSGTHSGRFDSAPTAACEVGSVQGLISEDGQSFAFPLGPLQFGDEFNVVLVAGATESGATNPFRIVFEQPETADIATVADAPAPSSPDRSGGGGGFTAPPPTSPPAQPSSSGSSTGGSFTPPPPPVSSGSASGSGSAPDVPAAAPVVSPVVPAIPSELQGETATAPFATQQSLPDVVEVVDREIGRLRLLGLLVLVLGTGCGLLWWRAEGSVPLRAVFTGVDATTLAQLNATVGDGEASEGGLGRFRRNRSGSAPRLF